MADGSGGRRTGASRADGRRERGLFSTPRESRDFIANRALPGTAKQGGAESLVELGRRKGSKRARVVLHAVWKPRIPATTGFQAAAQFAEGGGIAAPRPPRSGDQGSGVKRASEPLIDDFRLPPINFLAKARSI